MVSFGFCVLHFVMKIRMSEIPNGYPNRMRTCILYEFLKWAFEMLIAILLIIQSSTYFLSVLFIRISLLFFNFSIFLCFSLAKFHLKFKYEANGYFLVKKKHPKKMCTISHQNQHWHGFHHNWWQHTLILTFEVFLLLLLVAREIHWTMGHSYFVLLKERTK